MAWKQWVHGRLLTPTWCETCQYPLGTQDQDGHEPSVTGSAQKILGPAVRVCAKDPVSQGQMDAQEEMDSYEETMHNDRELGKREGSHGFCP